MRKSLNVCFNFTQHKLSQDQINDLESKDIVFLEMSEDDNAKVKELITFNSIPTVEEMVNRAAALVIIANSYRFSDDRPYAIIGGAPFFQSVLEGTLLRRNFTPLHAFSKRVVVETVSPSGETVKQSVFKHEGFYTVESFNN